MENHDGNEIILNNLDCGCHYCGTKEENHKSEHENPQRGKFIIFGFAVALYLFGIFLNLSFWAEFTIFFLSYLLVGGQVLIHALKNIAKGKLFDENFLMSVATIGAFAIQEFPEAVAIMLFYQIGEYFQDSAVDKSKKSITALMDIKPDYANLKQGDDYIRVSPNDVAIDELILVKPGERVPLDGVVTEGFSSLDTSALTGESLPRDIETGNEVLSGSINKNGLITLRVTKTFGESTVSKILDLVQNASSKKAKTENFITKFALYYTPIVVFSAIFLAVLPPLLIPDATFSEWVHRALVFLVVSCPCALVISIPLSFFGGIGGASKRGILIKGSNYLEALNNVDTVVFDKTGTLTKGSFQVTEVFKTEHYSKEDVLMYAAYAECYSSHPIASSIQKAYGKEINKSIVKDYHEIPGHGISIKLSDKEIIIGNSKLISNANVVFEKIERVGTILYLAIDQKFAGAIVISDEVKSDSKITIKSLHELGVKRIVMLTGDRKEVADKIGSELGIDEVYSELLPDQKVEKLEYLDQRKASKGKLIFVGDGINDAPVLARADIGVAMGGLGSDAAIEASDIVIMTDETSKLADAIKIAKRTRLIVWQNISLALGIKGIVLLLGAMGIATIWEAVFADVGVAILAILNSMRVIQTKH